MVISPPFKQICILPYNHHSLRYQNRLISLFFIFYLFVYLFIYLFICFPDVTRTFHTGTPSAFQVNYIRKRMGG